MAEEGRLENQYKVRLQVATDYTNMAKDVAEQRKRSVTFNVTPDLTEHRNVQYKQLDPLHLPGQIYVYSGTQSRTFELSNVRLISRTVKEATDNMRTLWTLRSWAMPYFGASSTLSIGQGKYREDQQQGTNTSGQPANQTPESRQQSGMELLGAPPDVLLLSAYSPNSEFTIPAGKSAGQRWTMTNIHNVPVVLTSLTIPYPSDIDYIPTDFQQPMPRIITINMGLAETHSPQEYNKFSLQDFRNGTLVNF